MFELDSRLRDDCQRIGSFRLCELLLMNDANYPWLILVPRIEGTTELVDLSPTEQHQMLEEINITSKVLKTVFSAEKINIASLGNLVPQLHIHCIARFSHDSAWPAPVWGKVNPAPYEQDQLTRATIDIVKAIREQGVHPFEALAPTA